MTINVQGIKTPSSLTIHYDTEPHQGYALLYRFSTSGQGYRTVILPDGRTLYHVELTDLMPGTQYYFTVGDGMRSFTSELSFRTIPAEGSLLFIEGGDWENTPAAVSLAKKAGTLNPNAVLLGGDYPSSVDRVADYRKWDTWLDVYKEYMVTTDGCLIPLVMAIGNHEVIGGFDRTKEDVPFFLHYFKQGSTGESYFSLPFGKRLHLFVLDSGHATPHDAAQGEWLRDAFEKTKSVPIKMALYHVPLFPSIRFADRDAIYRSFYGVVEFCNGVKSASRLFSPKSYEGRRHWMPLFDAYGLTVAFEHHDQTLKRTKLLRNGREDPRGTLYLGDGGWGPKVQYPPIQGYFHSFFANLQGKVHFFWVVSVEKERIVYSATTASGKILDQFTQKI